MADLDEQSQRLSASFTHLGSPKRVLLNDDEAEKRNRRRSRADRRRSNLLGPRQQIVLGRSSLSGDPITGPHGGSPLVQSLTPEELNRQYEEWMKIAADNKINTSNTWNFALIDYFHNMTLLREGDSINFQKASCTLDGCMKIYTSRVDSVATETGKLLSGLSESNARGQNGNDDDDDDQQRRKKKSSRTENTLVKDFSTITLKKFDLEFAVDPLFKKTSADFDEGGARGLLLNHLSTHDGLKIIFDASDSSEDEDGKNDEKEDTKKESEDDEVEEEEEEKINTEDTTCSMEEDTNEGETVLVKKEKPSNELNDSLDTEQQQQQQDAKNIEDNDTESENKIIVDTECILNVGKIKAKGLDLPLLQSDLSERDPLAENTMTRDDQELDDHFFDADVDNIGFDMAGYGDDIGGGVGENDDEDDEDDEDEDGERRQQRDTTSNPTEDEQGGIIPNFSEADFLASMSNNNNDLFSYFDSALNKNWAGPQHWKLLRPNKQLTSAEKTSQTVKTRKEKETFEIDFIKGDPVDMDALFAPATASINLPKTHDRAEEQNLLPNDLHFSARRLLSLFAKPTLMFTGKGRRRYIDPDMERVSADVDSVIRDAKFVEADNQDIVGINDDLDTMGDPIFNAPPGFDDDDDEVIGGGFDAGFEDEVDDDMPIIFEAEDTEYGNALVNATRTVKPAYINYAKTAKRVDVKRLKDNIWRKLTKKTDQLENSADKEEDIQDADLSTMTSPDTTQAQGEQRFTDIITGLKGVYAQETMKDISVSFCFICLLHLANEKNLKITGDQTLSDLTVVQDAVTR
ncbi:condensin complex subunit 2/barren [Syncephalis fuscata]|nr:condensin complex subunit 2/barren [Syncephalis fuscata]